MTAVLRSRRVVLPDGERPASVTVADGRIVAVGPFDVGGSEDLGDLALLPGLVDTHVHVNEPGRTEWEGFASATKAALAGGVTTIVDMPLNSLPPTVSVAALEAKRVAARDQAWVDVGFWGGAVPGNADDLPALWDAGVFGFKAFLADSGVPEFPPLSPAELRAAMSTVDGLFLVHAEDPSGLRPLASTRVYGDFLRSRPDVAEGEAVATALEAARAAGVRVHILHLSAAGAAPLVRMAREDGVRATVETCPHYLTLEAGAVPDGATEYKCCPPIRGGWNRESLWRSLADGTIDAVVSDHSPSTPTLKRLDTGDFAAAWGGIASLQLGLRLVWTEATARGFGLADVVRWMASGPAGVAGLTRKGRIAVGADADLVAFDPDETSTVDPSALRHRHPVTPYAGRPVRGAVRRVWLRGAEVSPDGPARGRLLSREAS